MTPRLLTAADVTFDLEHEIEDVPIEGNCSAIDDETDRLARGWILDQLDRGNTWAWCRVRVTARWNEFEGCDTLGCCSYRSEENFKNGDYHEAMQEAALEELNAKVAAAARAIAALGQV